MAARRIPTTQAPAVMYIAFVKAPVVVLMKSIMKGPPTPAMPTR